MTRRGFVVIGLSACLIGCSELISPGLEVRVEPVVSHRLVGYRDTELATLPAIRVTDFSMRRAIAGRAVEFTIQNPDGAMQTVAGTTDADGVSKLTNWRVGSQLGRYVISALTDGWGPIIFTVFVAGDVVAIYDLESLNGAAVSAAGRAHFVLYEAGFLNRFRGTPVTAFSAADEALGYYMRPSPDRILLTMECWFMFSGRCSSWGATAAVRGDEMIIDQGDYYGPWLEVYALRPSSEVN